MEPIKDQNQLDKMRVAGRHVAEILIKVRELVQPGILLSEIEKMVVEEILHRKLASSVFGYNPEFAPCPYPSVICTSVDHEVGHVPPTIRCLAKKDQLLKVDFAASYYGFHGDSAVTIPIGSISDEARTLMDVTLEALYAGIAKCRPGHPLVEVGAAIQGVVEKAGLYVVRDLSGHGIGEELHEWPRVYNFTGTDTDDYILEPGMTICIEPMVNVGTSEVFQEGWGVYTADKSLSAHFEHTVLITDDEPEILTKVEGSH